MRASTVACLLLASGCTAVFGLDEPVRRASDAAPPDDGPRDARVRDDAGSLDAPADAALDAPVDALACGPEFVTLGGSTTKYYHAVTPTTWTAAEADCESRGAHLVVPGSASETQTLAMALGAGPQVWLGYNDRRTEGAYQWVTDEDTGGFPAASGAPWATGEPDALDTTDCVVYFSTTPVGWHDRDCAAPHEYLCECDGYPANPMHY